MVSFVRRAFLTSPSPVVKSSRCFFLGPREVGFLLLLLGTSAPATAQNALYAEHHGKLLLVHGARANHPLVEENGHHVAAPTAKFLLKRIEEYRPVFVAIKDLQISGSQGSAEFESAYSLENVFFAMEFHFPKGDRTILLVHEVGRLKPQQSRKVLFGLPTEYEPGAAKFQLHLFVDGLEIFHSLQPAKEREQALDRMVAERVRQLRDAPPSPLFGPPAPYPRKVSQPKLPGTATVRCRINPQGVVLDPVVLAASEPAFGDAAVAALWDWRFIPRVIDGVAVECTVDLPLAFAPPPRS